MRYEQIDSQLFITNRKRLRALLKPNSIVVLHSNDVMPTNGDGVMPFKQNADLIHLTGADQEETILVLFPDAPNEKQREILFVRGKVKNTRKHAPQKSLGLRTSSGRTPSTRPFVASSSKRKTFTSAPTSIYAPKTW